MASNTAQEGVHDGFAKLHIFVVSLRCDHSCPYCRLD
jgi:hypothetical protein